MFRIHLHSQVLEPPTQLGEEPILLLADPLRHKAEKLVPFTSDLSKSSYKDLIDRFPVLEAYKLNRWNFYFTVCGVYVGLMGLWTRGLHEKRVARLSGLIYGTLKGWNEDGPDPLDERLGTFSRDISERRESKGDGDPGEYLIADVLGIWVVSNVIGHAPEGQETAPVWAIGKLLQGSFKDWWK